ncbi:M28 family peptidase [Mucilaginibacter sp. RB4R14]|uniref:M28 family peptidase n=1 Tax=Mucilaginibacter aurantiaciroseus TaxID=2949308 RepID=UPI002090BD78|nr:M28 family peptidase [Mucilaginibacter aurantiaciroseus]MCO5936558.1 M28 family peptidase [Mucilaginibacter aurantiaciroseus]
MKNLSVLITGLAISAAACAQQNPTALKYGNIINATDAKKHLSILASDEFEGRETGKPGAEKAANYIAAEFKRLGLQAPVNGSYFLDVPLTQNSVTLSPLTINGQAFASWKDFVYQGSANAKVTAADIVFVGFGTADELAGVDITGKVVLWINEDKPEAGKTPNTSYRMTDGRRAIVKAIQDKKPLLILAANEGVATVLARFKGVNPSGGGQISIKKTGAEAAKSTVAPLFIVNGPLADAALKATGKTFAELKEAAKTAKQTQVVKTTADVTITATTADVKAVDVLGFMPGKDAKLKNEVLVFSAHYDHIGLNPDPNAKDKVNNGADDDGSGTTGILEIARAFSKAQKDGKGPRRSVLFLGNVGEEKGLLGSEWYTDHPVYPLANTIADLNIDMIGRVGEEYIGKPDSANYVYSIGSAMLSTDLHDIGEAANNNYTKMKLDYKYDDPNDPNQFYYRSDHYNFAKHGVPIIFYFNGVHADYHGLGDEVNKINFPLLVKRAQLAFYTGWELANRDARPVVDKKSPAPTK